MATFLQRVISLAHDDAMRVVDSLTDDDVFSFWTAHDSTAAEAIYCARHGIAFEGNYDDVDTLAAGYRESLRDLVATEIGGVL